MPKSFEISSSIENDQRIVLYALACFIVAVVVGFLSRDLGLVFFKHIAQKTDTQLAQALTVEANQLLTDTKRIGARADLRQKITEEDAEGIALILAQENKETRIDALVVADSEGIALSRIPRFANLGDNVFVTTPVGRIAAQGIATTLFGVGRNFSIVLSATYPYLENQKIEGALMAGYWLDNEYAEHLKTTYFTKRHILFPKEVVIYSLEDGVIGDTFTDEATKQLFHAYLNNSSTYIDEGKTGDVVAVGGKDYVVTNHLISSQDGILGGIIVLSPLPLAVIWRSLTAGVLVVFLFFAGAAYIEHVTFRNAIGRRRRKTFVFLAFLSSGIFFLTWGGLYIHANRIIDRLDKPDFRIYNSTLKLRPESGAFIVGYPQQMSVVIRSGGESVNAIELALRYDSSIIRVDDITTNRSVCGNDYFLAKEIDNEAGLIKISCAIPGGFIDVRGIIADVTFTPIAKGETYFSFDAGTAVLANDGLATDVLRSSVGSFYRSLNKEDFNKEFSKKSLVVPFSRSHENSAKWYNSKVVKIGWTPREGTEYLYDFDMSASTTMSNPKKTSSSNLTLQAQTDGIYYFKIAPRKNDVRGLTTVLKLRIDTTPPETPSIKVSNPSVYTDEVVRFEFASEDDLSGVQPNFYVSIDGSINLPTSSRLYVPFSEAGVHELKVRAYDNAENYSESTVLIHVRKE